MYMLNNIRGNMCFWNKDAAKAAIYSVNGSQHSLFTGSDYMRWKFLWYLL